jgi:hypothetical protein
LRPVVTTDKKNFASPRARLSSSIPLRLLD